MKLAWIFFIFSLSTILCENGSYDEKQIIIMLNQYFESSFDNKLLGYHTFVEDDKNTFQIEVRTNIATFNNSMVEAFSVINKLTNVSKKNFAQAIVIFHFNTNKLPIIAKSDLNCSRKFFIEQTQNEIQWRKKCLSIQHF